MEKVLTKKNNFIKIILNEIKTLEYIIIKISYLSCNMNEWMNEWMEKYNNTEWNRVAMCLILIQCKFGIQLRFTVSYSLWTEIPSQMLCSRRVQWNANQVNCTKNSRYETRLILNNCKSNSNRIYFLISIVSIWFMASHIWRHINWYLIGIW